MAEFTIEQSDYQRYGLDDPRSSRRRPEGLVRIAMPASANDGHWQIATDHRQWVFDQPLSVQKLHDRFALHFSYPEISHAGLLLLVPFDALSSDEAAVLATLTEKRYPSNTPGDFYAVAGECICIDACVPVVVAPDLIDYQSEPEGCYFVRQPETKAEIDRAIEAVLSAFVGNLRYGGSDPMIIRRIRAATRDMKLSHCQSDLCDYPTELVDQTAQVR